MRPSRHAYGSSTSQILTANRVILKFSYLTVAIFVQLGSVDTADNNNNTAMRILTVKLNNGWRSGNLD